MICKIKNLLQCHFLKTSKLSDPLYEFWKMLFLDSHSHLSIGMQYFVANNIVFHLTVPFKSMSSTRIVRIHQ